MLDIPMPQRCAKRVIRLLTDRGPLLLSDLRRSVNPSQRFYLDEVLDNDPRFEVERVSFGGRRVSLRDQP